MYCKIFDECSMQKYENNFRVCRAIEIDILVTKWERQVEDNKKLPPNMRVPVPKRSDDLIPKRWKAVAIGALEEASEAYLVGKCPTCSECGTLFKE